MIGPKGLYSSLLQPVLEKSTDYHFIVTLIYLFIFGAIYTYLYLYLYLTGYTSEGSLTYSGQSAGFDLTGPASFLLAQSHTELRLTDLLISDYLNIQGMILRPANYKKKLLQYTLKNDKVGIWVSTRKLPVYMSWQFLHGSARARPGEAGTIKAASV